MAAYIFKSEITGEIEAPTTRDKWGMEEIAWYTSMSSSEKRVLKEEFLEEVPSSWEPTKNLSRSESLVINMTSGSKTNGEK